MVNTQQLDAYKVYYLENPKKFGSQVSDYEYYVYDSSDNAFRALQQPEVHIPNTKEVRQSFSVVLDNRHTAKVTSILRTLNNQ